jgi:hypothetical protein
MKKCPKCQKEIDQKASKCPFCQSDLRSWFRRHPILTVLLVLIGLGIVGSIAGGGKSSTSSNSTTGSATANSGETKKLEPTTVEVMKVDAKAFMAEFDSNQLRAEEMYKDKVVELTAVVKNISEDIIGSPFLSLEPQGAEFSMASIKCIFAQKAQITSVEKGSMVTVQGKVSDQSLGIIQLNNCSLVQ